MKFHMNAQRATILDDRGAVTHERQSNALTRDFMAGSIKELGLLPPAVRWISADSRAFIVERPPATHTVRHSRLVGGDATAYTIPVPWTVYGLKFKNDSMEGLEVMYMFVRPYHITTKYDALFTAYYPNIYGGSSKVCVSEELQGEHFGSVFNAINVCVEGFWTSQFNEDLRGRLSAMKSTHGTIHGYLKHLETRSIEQVLEDVGPVFEPIPTVEKLIEILQTDGENKAQRTIAYLKDMVSK